MLSLCIPANDLQQDKVPFSSRSGSPSILTFTHAEALGFSQFCSREGGRGEGRGGEMIRGISAVQWNAIWAQHRWQNKCAGTGLYVKMGEECSTLRSVQTSVQAHT